MPAVQWCLHGIRTLLCVLLICNVVPSLSDSFSGPSAVLNTEPAQLRCQVAFLMQHYEQRIVPSRQNLEQLVCGAKELTALAAVQRLLERGFHEAVCNTSSLAWWHFRISPNNHVVLHNFFCQLLVLLCAGGADAAVESSPATMPSCLLGLVVRLKFYGCYILRPLYGLAMPLPSAGNLNGPQQQGQHVWVGSPSADPRSPAVVGLPLTAISGTNPLEGQLWESDGSAEVAELSSWLRARQQALLLPAVGGATRRPCSAVHPLCSLGGWVATRMTLHASNSCAQAQPTSLSSIVACCPCRLPQQRGAGERRSAGTLSTGSRQRRSSCSTCRSCWHSLGTRHPFPRQRRAFSWRSRIRARASRWLQQTGRGRQRRVPQHQHLPRRQWSP